MFNAQRPILETLTREMSTMRVRDVNSGEKLDSVWDDVMRSHCVPLNMEKQCISDESWVNDYFYNEDDAAEDSVLFSDELLAGIMKHVCEGGESAIDDYLRRGPEWDRFIMDLEIDEELSDRHDSHCENGSSSETADTSTDGHTNGWSPSSNNDRFDRRSI
ncbi:MAG: hypothetical protein LQ352_002207 [Teloschistes flavicans]|nr:MAG: hypothetical protein LQ352_002207 [Teloschistes flavicans]